MKEISDELSAAEPDRSIDVAVEDGQQAVFDAELMRIALTNLLGNAWKFTRHCPKPAIEFGAIEQDGEKVFFVRDNGVGFDPKKADRVFVPFVRLHSETEYEGQGIGLATVQRIINKHGGRIWAEGEVGKGATFFFTLGRR